MNSYSTACIIILLINIAAAAGDCPYKCNTLKEIPDHSLPETLKFIEFKDTPIATIGPNAFDLLGENLEHLEFAGPSFTKIPDTFAALKALNFFQLAFAQISDWNLGALKGFGPSLETLRLDFVGLTSWPDWMQYFTSLKTIEISSMPVAPFPDDAFDAFKDSVTDLKFSTVDLKEISPAFSKLTELETLFILNNSLTDVANLPKSSKLASLALSQNKIVSSSSLVQNLLTYSKSLLFLDLSINKLTEFPDLSGLSVLNITDLENNELVDPITPSLPPSISMLYLRSNKLTKIPQSVSSMDNLKILLIAYNNIAEIKGTDIPAVLPELDVSYNQITSLQHDSFPENSSLTNLDMSSNPLSKISPDAFENLSQLQNLALQDTRLTNIPMALKSLTSLETLSMDNNGQLVCSCRDAILLPWFNSLPNLRIDGKCGSMTIPYFFKEIAPKCV